MKFQCGTCGKYYLIENAELISTKQCLRCTGCGNLFILQKDLAFSSSHRNSKLICHRCGSLVDEASDTCPSCNPALKSLREELLIDNRDYAFFVVRRGRIQPKQGSRRLTKAMLLAGLGAVLLAIAALIVFLPGSKRDALKRAALKPLGIKCSIATRVVILRSGMSLYADKVERTGGKVRITEKSGKVLTVDENDVAYVAEAVLEE